MPCLAPLVVQAAPAKKPSPAPDFRTAPTARLSRLALSLDPFGGDARIIQPKPRRAQKLIDCHRRGPRARFKSARPGLTRRGTYLIRQGTCKPFSRRNRMKRIQEKIKDLNAPQSFEQVGNFADDPAQALAAYRFTDVTSDLLSRWLDVLADLAPGTGAAHALAGARGVGKSHTLAVRSEEHTSELQSRQYLVCRLLLEKKKTRLL